MKFSAASILLFASAASLAVASNSHSKPAIASRNHRARRAALEARNAASNVTETLVKRGSGSATWYETQTGNAGSCGSMLNDNDYTVALASPGWNIVPNACGQTIVITANGKTTTATIQDTCPTGGGNCGGPCDIDMSPGLFKYFAGLGDGKIGVSWYYQSSGKSCDGSGGGGGGSSGGNSGGNSGGGNSGGGNDNSGGNDNNNGGGDNSGGDNSGDNGAAAAASSSSAAAAAASASASKAAAASSSRAAAASRSSASRASSLSSKSAASSRSRAAAAAKSSAAAKASAAAEEAFQAAPKNLYNLNNILGGFQNFAGNVQPTPAPTR